MEYRLWIDGAWKDTQGGKTMTIENPATENPLATVIDASAADVDRAVLSFGKDLPAAAVADYRVTKHVMVALS